MPYSHLLKLIRFNSYVTRGDSAGSCAIFCSMCSPLARWGSLDLKKDSKAVDPPSFLPSLTANTPVFLLYCGVGPAHHMLCGIWTRMPDRMSGYMQERMSNRMSEYTWIYICNHMHTYAINVRNYVRIVCVCVSGWVLLAVKYFSLWQISMQWGILALANRYTMLQARWRCYVAMTAMIWVDYNDLTVLPHHRWWLIKGIIPFYGLHSG